MFGVVRGGSASPAAQNNRTFRRSAWWLLIGEEEGLGDRKHICMSFDVTECA